MASAAEKQPETPSATRSCDSKENELITATSPDHVDSAALTISQLEELEDHLVEIISIAGNAANKMSKNADAADMGRQFASLLSRVFQKLRNFEKARKNQKVEIYNSLTTPTNYFEQQRHDYMKQLVGDIDSFNLVSE